MANYIISSGETCTGIVLNYGDQLTVQNGGYAVNTTVNSGGSLFVQNGGIASGVKTSSGYVRVSNGGYMENAELCFGGDGLVTVEKGGILSSAQVLDGLGLYVYGSVYDLVLSRSENNGGNLSDLFLMNGGYAENVTIYSSSYLCMDNNTIVNGLTVLESNIMVNIPGGAKIENMHQNPFTPNSPIPTQAIVSYDSSNLSGVFYGSGYQVYSSAQSMESVVLEPNTSMFVCSGGTVSDITVSSGAVFSVADGGSATGILISSGAKLDLTVSPETRLQGKYNGKAFELKNNVFSGLVVESRVKLAVAGGVLASNTTVKSGGSMSVLSGGTADDVTVKEDGYFYVDGGVVNSTVVSGSQGSEWWDVRFAHMIIRQDGVANDTVIERGDLILSSGGVVNNIEITTSGSITVLDGATVNNAVMNDGSEGYESGAIYVSNGGSVNGVTLGRYRQFHVFEGGVVSNAVLNDGSDNYVYAGGTADGATVNAGAVLHVEAGGQAADVEVNSGGNLISMENIENVTVNAGGKLNGFSFDETHVFSENMVFENLLVKSTDSVYVFEGQSAGINQVQSGGKLNGFTFQEDGTISGVELNNVRIDNGEAGILYNGQNVDSVTVHSNGGLFVSSGASVANASVKLYASMYVSSNGSVSDVSIQRGQLIVENGGYASGVTLTAPSNRDQGDIYIRNGGIVEDVQIKTFGDCYVENGATLRGAVVSASGFVSAYNGSLENIEIRSGGSVHVNGAGEASEIYVSNGAYLIIDSNTSLSALHVESGAYVNGFSFTQSAVYDNLNSGTIRGVAVSSNTINLSSGMTLEDVTVIGGGRLFVQDGAAIVHAALASGGSVSIASSGSVEDLTVGSGAVLSNSILKHNAQGIVLEGGAVLYGSIRLDTNLTVNGSIDASNADIVIDLTDRTNPEDAIFSNISGIQAKTWQIQLEQNPQPATYVLGKNAAGFTGTITVSDRPGNSIGTLSLSTDPISIETISYSLYLNMQNDLCFTVSSNIMNSPDGVFLYKNGTLFASYPEISDLDINGDGDFDHVYVAKDGNNDGWTIRNNGLLTIISGGAVQNATVSGGIMHVSSGGTVDGVDVVSNGYLHVSEGGIVSGLRTDSYGYVTVSSGGLVEGAYLSGGIRNRLVTVEPGGVLSSAEVVDGVDLFVSGAAHDIVLSATRNDGDYTELYLRGSGYAENVNVFRYGILDIQDYSAVSGTVINSGGSLNLGISATLSDITVSSQGRANIEGKINNIQISSGGYVSAGNSSLIGGIGIHSGASAHLNGKVYDANVASGASMYMGTWGAGTYRATIASGAYASIGSGVEIQDMTIKDGGRIYLSDVVSATNLHVESGAVINGLKMESEQIFESGLVFSSIVITPGTSAYFNNGQMGIDVTITSGGYLSTSNGAVAENVTVSSGARLDVYSGANVNQVSVSSGASLSVNGGANMDDITVSSGGNFRYAVDAHATHIGLKAGARINNIALANAISADSLDDFVISGGIVSSTDATVYSGQVASNITVQSGGALTIQNGAVMKGLVLSSGARLQLPGGAVLEDMSFMSGAYVNNILISEDAAYESMSGFVLTGGTVAYSGSWGSWINANLYLGQSAADTLVESFTRLYVSSGAQAGNTEVLGELRVLNGGMATDTVVQSGGYAWTSRGAFDRITVNPGGRLEVNWYGSASIVFNPWQGSISSNSYSTVTYLDRDANVYYGGPGVGTISKADSFGSLNICVCALYAVERHDHSRRRRDRDGS